MSRYTFEHQLTALRALLFREDYFEHPYGTATHNDIKPLVILMETYLKSVEVSHDKRRNMRLDILSFILGFKVHTTYDLTPYQSSTIYHFLVDSSATQRLGVSANEFLENCKKRVEEQTVYRAGSNDSNSLLNHRKTTNMSNM